MSVYVCVCMRERARQFGDCWKYSKNFVWVFFAEIKLKWGIIILKSHTRDNKLLAEGSMIAIAWWWQSWNHIEMTFIMSRHLNLVCQISRNSKNKFMFAKYWAKNKNRKISHLFLSSQRIVHTFLWMASVWTPFEATANNQKRRRIKRAQTETRIHLNSNNCSHKYNANNRSTTKITFYFIGISILNADDDHSDGFIFERSKSRHMSINLFILNTFTHFWSRLKFWICVVLFVKTKRDDHFCPQNGIQKCLIILIEL